MGAAELAEVVKRQRARNDAHAASERIDETGPRLEQRLGFLKVIAGRLTQKDLHDYLYDEGCRSPHVADLISAALDWADEAARAARSR